MSRAPTAVHRVHTVRVTFTRIGPEVPRRRTPTTYPELVVTVPQHTAKDPEAARRYIGALVHQCAQMHMPPDVTRYTVAVDTDALGNGHATLTEHHLARGAAELLPSRARPVRDLGHATLTAEGR